MDAKELTKVVGRHADDLEDLRKDVAYDAKDHVEDANTCD